MYWGDRAPERKVWRQGIAATRRAILEQRWEAVFKNLLLLADKVKTEEEAMVWSGMNEAAHFLCEKWPQDHMMRVEAQHHDVVWGNIERDVKRFMRKRVK